MQTIEVKPIWGKDPRYEMLGNGSIVITLTADHFISRSQYRYMGPKDAADEKSPIREMLVNEKYYIRKEFITGIGVSYDNDDEIYFVQVKGMGVPDNFYNVENAAAGNDLLKTLVDWWQS